MKEDIEEARKNDFGLKMFEAFAAPEYATSHRMKSQNETAKPIKVVAAKDKQLAEAKAFAVKAKNLAEAKDTEAQAYGTNLNAKKQLILLIEPLNKGQRDIHDRFTESHKQTDYSSCLISIHRSYLTVKLPRSRRQ